MLEKTIGRANSAEIRNGIFRSVCAAIEVATVQADEHWSEKLNLSSRREDTESAQKLISQIALGQTFLASGNR